MALSNTQQRIISALVLMGLVAVFLYFGQFYTKILIILVGLITVEEVIVNFLKKRRTDAVYLLNVFSFLVLTSLLFLKNINEYCLYFYISAILLHIFLLYYLFATKIEDKFFKKLLISNKLPIVLFLFPPFSMILFLVDKSHWLQYLLLLLIITFSTDIGAWFFGRRYGKRKLWESISPNKTVEGLIGGVFSSASLSTLVFYLMFNHLKMYYFFLFLILSLISHLGDLIQSKIKREFDIKDSSSLIPGHGGVYDRIDSLLFLSPFYVGILLLFKI